MEILNLDIKKEEKKKEALPIKTDKPIILSNRLYVPYDLVTEEIKDAFTYKLSKDENTEDLDEYGDIASHKIKLWRPFKDGEYYGFCRGDIGKLKKLFDWSLVDDQRSRQKMKIPITFNTPILRPYQVSCIDQWMTKQYGTIDAPPRSGKTVVIANLICTLSYQSLILVDQDELADQFYATFMNLNISKETGKPIIFTNAPELEEKYKTKLVGIAKSLKDIEKDWCVTIMTWQKWIRHAGLLKKERDRWGFVANDEHHVTSAPVYSKILNVLNPKIRTGCSATVERKDGLQIIAENILGPVTAYGKSDQLVCKVTYIHTNYEVKPFNMYTNFIANMVKDKKRNELIVSAITKDAKAGRHCLVATLRVGHAKLIGELLKENDIECEVLTSKSYDRKGILTRFREGNLKVIVATRQLTQKGLDLPPLDCVTGDTLIYTSKGIKRIDSFKDHRKVRKVYPIYKWAIASGRHIIKENNTWHYHGKKKIIKIKLKNGYSLKGSYEHKVLILKPDLTFVYKELKNLEIGDKVALRKGTNLFAEKVPDFSKFIYNPPKDKSVNIGNFKNKIEDYIEIPKKMSIELCRLLGYFLSDGSVSDITDSFFQFSNTNEKLAMEVKILSKNLFNLKDSDITWSVSSTVAEKPFYNICIRSRKMTQFYRFIGVGRTKSKTHVIPWSVLESPKHFLVNFLQTLFEGDGQNASSSKLDKVCYFSTSLKLIEQIQVVLLNFGIDSKICKREQNEKIISGKEYLCSPSFYLDITGLNASVFLKDINFVTKKTIPNNHSGCQSSAIPYISAHLLKFKKIRKINNSGYYLNDYFEHVKVNFNRVPISKVLLKNKEGFLKELKKLSYFEYAKVKTLLTNDFIFKSVEEIKFLKKEKDVFDLTVPFDHSYCANGLVVHNCQFFLVPNFNPHNLIQECSRCRTPYQGKPQPILRVFVDRGHNITFAAKNAFHSVFKKQNFTFEEDTTTRNNFLEKKDKNKNFWGGDTRE